MSLKPTQLFAVIAVVVILAAGVIYFLPGRPDTVSLEGSQSAGTAATQTAASTSGGELMIAGPLGEKTLGDPSAPNIVIEYASMTCSHCQTFHADVFATLKEKYIDTGQVYFIFREYPLDPLATSAIMLARCAPEDRFFPIVDLLFEQQRNWAFTDNPVSALRNLVRQAGISQNDFTSCLTNQTILDGVNWVKNRGSTEFAVSSTPTFFINGERWPGVILLDQLEEILGG